MGTCASYLIVRIDIIELTASIEFIDLTGGNRTLHRLNIFTLRVLLVQQR